MTGKSKPPFLRSSKFSFRQLIGVALVLGALWFVFYGRGMRDVEQLEVTGDAFHTRYAVKVITRTPKDGTLEELKKRVEAEIEFVDKEMSRFRKDSTLSRFNDARKTDPFPVSKELGTLFQRARQVSEMSGGAFDITVGPLVRLWGFYNNERSLATRPSQAEIEAARALVGYKRLVVDDSQDFVRKTDPLLHVDLSAMAKGFAVDRIAKALDAADTKNYLVEIGGEVRAKGKNKEKRDWRIAIEKPVFDNRELYQVVALPDKSIATSGDYRNYYELGGEMVSHTIDPRTGQPLKHGLASVSVIHDECALADALATAFTVLGPKDGYDLAETRGIPALFITRKKDGTLEARATAGFSDYTVSRANDSE